MGKNFVHKGHEQSRNLSTEDEVVSVWFLPLFFLNPILGALRVRIVILTNILYGLSFLAYSFGCMSDWSNYFTNPMRGSWYNITDRPNSTVTSLLQLAIMLISINKYKKK